MLFKLCLILVLGTCLVNSRHLEKRILRFGVRNNEIMFDTFQPEESKPVAEPDQFECPKAYGYFPHRLPNKFWVCTDWEAVEKTCPENTIWNESLLTCIKQ